jgi:PncC family amidohydrolase
MKPKSLDERVAAALLRRGWDLALAESCTGGLLGFRVTSLAGSSRYFRGGVVAYEDAAKVRTLGVKPSTLLRHGAVSAETAVEMARGARKLFKTKAALSVTGIAGPGGGTPAKPRGLVYAAAVAGGRRKWVEGRFRGGRSNVRRRSAEMALNLLLSVLEDET